MLTYDEPLDEDSVPAAAAYAVNVDGGGGATASASVAVGGSAVTLTLGTAIIGGQTVTVSCTVRSTGPCRTWRPTTPRPLGLLGTDTPTRGQWRGFARVYH